MFSRYRHSARPIVRRRGGRRRKSPRRGPGDASSLNDLSRESQLWSGSRSEPAVVEWCVAPDVCRRLLHFSSGALERARDYPPAGNEESSRISRVLTADRGLPADEHQTPAALRGAVLIAAFLGTEMQHLPVHRARYAGSGGNISPAYGVLLQLPANHHVGPRRRRSLARHVAPGLEEAAKQRSQECEDQQGEEKIDDEVTQHGGGAGNCSPPPNSLTEPTFSSWRAKRWGSCTPCPPSCSSIPACLWRSRRIVRWAPVAGTSGTPPPCPPPASLCHRPRTTPCQSDRLPTGSRNPHGSGPVRWPS